MGLFFDPASPGMYGIGREGSERVGIGTKGNLPRICEMVNRPHGLGTTPTKLMSRELQKFQDLRWLDSEPWMLNTCTTSLRCS